MKLSRKKTNEPSRSALDRRRAGRRARIVRSSVGKTHEDIPKESNTQIAQKARISIILVILVTLIVWNGFISGVEVRGKGIAKQQASELSSSYFKGMRRLWWFVSIDEFKTQTARNAPYVDQVSIRHDFFTRKAIIDVTSRHPSLRLRTQNRQYVVSNDGIILEEADGDVTLPLVYDESKTDTLTLHKPYIPENMVDHITDIHEELKPHKGLFKFKEFVLSDNTREVDAHQFDGYFIKFNVTTTAKRQVADYIVARSKVIPERLNSLEYIDVRFSGRVYIK